MKAKRILMAALLALLGLLPFDGMSQRLVFTYSFGGCSGGSIYSGIVRARLEALYEDWATHTPESKEECEYYRNNLMNNFAPQYPDCIIHINAQCVGFGSFGSESLEQSPIEAILGVNHGSGFNSTNPANEVRDWGEDCDELINKLMGGMPMYDGEDYGFPESLPKSAMLFQKGEIIDHAKYHPEAKEKELYLDADKPFKSLNAFDEWKDNKPVVIDGWDGDRPDEILLEPFEYSPVPPMTREELENRIDLWTDFLCLSSSVGFIAYSTLAASTVAALPLLAVEELVVANICVWTEVVGALYYFYKTGQGTDGILKNAWNKYKMNGMVTAVFSLGSGAYSAEGVNVKSNIKVAKGFQAVNIGLGTVKVYKDLKKINKEGYENVE